jgi:hypothetical protein
MLGSSTAEPPDIAPLLFCLAKYRAGDYTLAPGVRHCGAIDSLSDRAYLSLHKGSFMNFRGKAARRALLLALSVLIAAGRLRAQVVSAPTDVSGSYEGVARTESHGDIPISIELRQERGAITGSMGTPLGDLSITGGSFAAGTLKIESYDDVGTITATVEGGRLVGEFVGFGERGRLELKRTGPPSPVVDTRPVAALGAEKWREDLRYLAAELPRRHKNAFWLVTREQFESAVADLDRRIPTMQASDVVMGLSRIVAMIGDGHTYLDWGSLYPNVPLRLYWFGGELRVTETVAEYRRALSARVVRVGGADVREALRRDRPYISQGESEGFVLSTDAQHLANPAHLHALGLAPDAARATYTFVDEWGRRFTLTLKTAAPGERVEWIDAAGATPLYLKRKDEPLWYEYLPESRTLYLNFAGYPRRPDFAKLSQEFFDFADRHDVRRVVIDMRLNGGGDFSRGRDFIISKFKQRPALTARGHLFVVIGRWTFSAGMANAADFRNEFRAIMVGEPTGARPNGYQENRHFSLPNSHLGVSYSTQLYKFQERDTPGIVC